MANITHDLHIAACCAWLNLYVCAFVTAYWYLAHTGDLVSKAEAQQRIKEYEEDEIDSLYFLHLRYVSSSCATCISSIPFWTTSRHGTYKALLHL